MATVQRPPSDVRSGSRTRRAVTVTVRIPLLGTGANVRTTVSHCLHFTAGSIPAVTTGPPTTPLSPRSLLCVVPPHVPPAAITVQSPRLGPIAHPTLPEAHQLSGLGILSFT